MQYAGHVLGHAPRDSYEKQATLYPEKLRSEYAKASGRLNIFTSIERHLRAAGVDSGGRQEGKVAAEGYRCQKIEDRPAPHGPACSSLLAAQQSPA